MSPAFPVIQGAQFEMQSSQGRNENVKNANMTQRKMFLEQIRLSVKIPFSPLIRKCLRSLSCENSESGSDEIRRILLHDDISRNLRDLSD
ncbi:MAG TPA: hypothetical protein DIW81_28075 [Planctomycetaceae bacterium]|nr:hypothetical protein [Planctomycetaceae bacterium]